jgi:branched-chain amino acid transport system substrate-binding protein
MVAPPEWAEIAAPGVVERLAAEGVAPEGYVLPAHAAVEIALQAVRAAEEAGLSVAGALGANGFDTALGPVRFDDKGDWAGDHHRLYRYDGNAFQPTD